MTTTTAKPATTTTTTSPSPAVTVLSEEAAQAAIAVAAKALGLPTVRAEATAIAAAAAKARLTHLAYLAEVLSAEYDDREHRRRLRRVNEAKFPRHKRLSEFETARLPDLPEATLAHLATGAWIDAGQPLVLIGPAGTGKSHYAEARVMPTPG